MKYIVEIIVCEYDESGTRWKADGTLTAKEVSRVLIAFGLSSLIVIYGLNPNF